MAQDSGGGGGSTSPAPGTSTTVPEAAVTTPIFGEATANSQDVPFPFALMPPAARSLWQLADDVAAAKRGLLTAQETASRDFKGPVKDQFDAKCSTFGQSADNVEATLRELARGMGRAWAAARGQQDRICAARGFAKRESEESGLNKFGDGLFGDERPADPDNPPASTPPSFPIVDGRHEDGCGSPHPNDRGASSYA